MKGTRPKSVMKNAGWNVFSTVWSIAIGFLLTPMLIYHLGVTQYGILLLIWSITGMLGIVNFGLGEATLRYVAYHYGNGDLQGVNRVLGATLSFYALICIVIAGVMLAAAPAVASLLNIPAADLDLFHWLLRISAVVFSLGIFSRAFGAIPMALHRYDVSSKVNIGQSVMRSAGYVLLVMSGFGILSLVLWDVVMYAGLLCVQAAVIRRLSPGVRLSPSGSLLGLREIAGYSVFSFLTYVFMMLFRESGKLMLGRFLGPSHVAYFGTPDNVAHRIHAVISSGSETLLPRFSSNNDRQNAGTLFMSATWATLAASVVLFIPMAVLMPDFLRLWINPGFALESAAVGQLLALSYITQGAFAPPAAYFRGSNKPWFVSAVLFAAGVVTILSGVMLIPEYGVTGAGYAYLIGSTAHLAGLLCGWGYLLGTSSIAPLARYVGMPLLLAVIAFVIQSYVRGLFVDPEWFGLFGLAGLFAGLTGLIVVAADLALGGASPARAILERFRRSGRVEQLLGYLRAIRA